mmetsp:Transcript_12105/g.26097  ORF Transcript_12105/g.26097 Transcript_12105/m.26097 type:complete len:285 (+) Transcript_12105:319-1173(+)
MSQAPPHTIAKEEDAGRVEGHAGQLSRLLHRGNAPYAQRGEQRRHQRREREQQGRRNVQPRQRRTTRRRLAGRIDIIVATIAPHRAAHHTQTRQSRGKGRGEQRRRKRRRVHRIDRVRNHVRDSDLRQFGKSPPPPSTTSPLRGEFGEQRLRTPSRHAHAVHGRVRRQGMVHRGGGERERTAARSGDHALLRREGEGRMVEQRSGGWSSEERRGRWRSSSSDGRRWWRRWWSRRSAWSAAAFEESRRHAISSFSDARSSRSHATAATATSPSASQQDDAREQQR